MFVHRGFSYDWQYAIVVLSYTMVTAVVVACLYWAQAVFLPFALAVLLTLILSPPVGLLQRAGVPRVPAVLLAVALATCVVLAIGWVVTRQFVQLAGELPAYQENIRAKIRSVREMSTGSTGRFGKFVEELVEEVQQRPAKDGSAKSSAAAAASGSGAPGADDAGQPSPTVIVESDTPPWIGQLTAALGSVGEVLAEFALASVLTLFMLLNREQLRDRLIRLIGNGRLTATTRAFDDAVHRISRFLLAQLIVNGTYGLTLALGLLVLGIEYAFLWGLLAAVLRYLPYVGPWIAAIPPVLLSLVMTPGWVSPLLVIGLIVLIELVSNNVVEPLLYGQSMGVSTVGLLIAAAFWAFLWGPIGLVLSSPLTVCLVVAGKYVPNLKFIDILLGDGPALEPDISFYQRLLARDKFEATEIALAQADKMPLGAVFDSLVVPALSYFKRDREQDELTDDDEEYILGAIEEIVSELVDAQAENSDDESRGEGAGGEAPVDRRVRLFACAAPDEADYLTLEMLTRLVEPHRWEVRVASTETLASEIVNLAAELQPRVVCIAALPPGGLAHTRYLCKRLRAQAPDTRILVGRWGPTSGTSSVLEQLRDVGVAEVKHSLVDAARQLTIWWPSLSQAPKRVESKPADDERTITSTASG